MSVVILGATSRIAREIALRYAEAGELVHVAARDAGEAGAIAADVALRTGGVCTGGAFDATAFDTHGPALDDVEDRLGPIRVAVLAFGEMGDQAESQAAFDAAHHVIDVNYTGAVSVCEALAARMVPRHEGAIVGIASVAGDRGRQSNYVYGSAKGAFALYLSGLRNRLYGEGVGVTTVKLGFVDTRMTYGMATKIPIASPEAASRAIVAAQRRGADVLYYPAFWRGVMGVIRAIPEGVFKRLSL